MKENENIPFSPTSILRGHTSEITTVTFVQEKLISGDVEGNVHLWNLKTRRTEVKIKPHTHILTIEKMKENKFLTHGREGVIKIWNLDELNDEKSCLKEFNLMNENQNSKQLSFCKCKFNEFDFSIFTPSTSNMSSISVLSLKDEKLNKEILLDNEKYGMLMCLNLKNENIIQSGFENGSILEIDLRKENKVLNEIKLFKDPVLCIKNENGSLISTSTSNIISVLNDETFGLKKEFSMNKGGINDISISSKDNFRIFSTGGWDNRIRIFDLKKLKPLTILKQHTQSVNCLEFKKDSNLLACGSKDQRISLWDLNFKKKEK
eukprot:gene2474-3183_t